MSSAKSPDTASTSGQASDQDKEVTVNRTENKDTFKREAFGGRRLRLSVLNKDARYHYGWFRDQGDNLVQLRRAGYEPVTFREAAREVPEALENAEERLRPEDSCRTYGGMGEGGRPYNMILMKQPIEFYEADQADGAKRADDIDEAIFRPEFKDGKVVGNQYGDVNVSVRDKE